LDFDKQILRLLLETQVENVFQLLLGKLGAATISMESIVGPLRPLSGIDLEGIQSYDELLPDIGSYLEGALQAKNELFHLCREVCMICLVTWCLTSLDPVKDGQ
jgi:hypothetical protein